MVSTYRRCQTIPYYASGPETYEWVPDHAAIRGEVVISREGRQRVITGVDPLVVPKDVLVFLEGETAVALVPMYSHGS